VSRFWDDLSLSFSQGLRALGARYPVIFAVSLGLGMLLKILIDASAKVAGSDFLSQVNQYNWYHFALVVLALLLIPALLGYSRVPDETASKIAGVRHIIEAGGLSKEQGKFYWLQLLKNYVAEAGRDTPSLNETEQSAEKSDLSRPTPS
jgi:hypothetical protein